MLVHGWVICFTEFVYYSAEWYSTVWMYHNVSIHFLFFPFLFLNPYPYAALSLHCCTWAFSSCGERGLLFVAMHGLLIAMASLVVEHGLWAHRLQ